MCSADELRAKFERSSTRVLHAAETRMWPRATLHHLVRLGRVADPYPHSPTPIRYGNTGQYMGRASDLVEYYFRRMRLAWEGDTSPATWTWCCPFSERYLPTSFHTKERNMTDCFNDQRCIHTFVAAKLHQPGTVHGRTRPPSEPGLPILKFDQTADVFLTASKVHHRVKVCNGRIHFNMSQALVSRRRVGRWQSWQLADREYTRPCWLHCAGSAKYRYAPLVNELMAATGRGLSNAPGPGGSACAETAP